MQFKHYATLVLGTVLTVAPQFVTAVPGGYRDIATAAFALATAFYHLLQTPPTVVK